MKVLVSDNLGEVGIRMFQEAEGIEVDVKTGLSPEDLESIIGAYDALVIRSATRVTEDLLEAASNLKVVGRAGIGLDNVDIPAATKRGVVVMNTPTGNVITTAEHAVAMMLALTRNIPQGTATLKSGRWEKKKLQGQEIFNKTLGVIGFGKIGSIVADRAKGLRMQVIIHDPHVTFEQIEKAGFESVSLDDLLKRSDYITVHVPKLKETQGFINQSVFERMKDGVRFINCARGGIVNEADLYDAMKSGKVAGAALDVFETEPPEASPLFELDNFICTPHLGASTQEAQANVAIAVAEQIIAYLTTGTVINSVNTPSVTGELLEKLRPYLSLGDRLGCLMAQLSEGPVKEVGIEYMGDFHGLDLSPVSTAILKGLLTPMISDMVNSVNAPIIAKDRGIKVSETRQADAEDYINLIRVRAKTPEKSTSLDGTVFGKNDPRIVKINNFRLEMIPHGHSAIIHNKDVPGAIGSIGTTLGDNKINIGRMQVGQEEEGDRNIIFLRTDTPIPPKVVEQLRALPLVNSVIPLEL
jgi:D-3-phosphoglycerate dehydrogenase / 2-oxoglutarate reductase